MVLARVLLLLCVFCVVCVPVYGGGKQIKSTSSKRRNLATASTPAVKRNDEIMTDLEGFLNGKHSIDFTIFGQKVHIRMPKVPSSLAEVTITVHRFIKRLRKDPFTRTLVVISANIVLLLLLYTILFVANIHLALKHRRAIEAASNGNSLLMRSRSIKIDMPRTPHKDVMIPHVPTRSGTRKLGTPATNLDVGPLHSQKKELKGKLSFNTTTSEADIPRLADHSSTDVFTSSNDSTSRSTHLNLGSETSHEHITVEVHKEDVDKKAHSLNVEESTGIPSKSDQLPSTDQQAAAVDSPKQVSGNDSP